MKPIFRNYGLIIGIAAGVVALVIGFDRYVSGGIGVIVGVVSYRVLIAREERRRQNEASGEWYSSFDETASKKKEHTEDDRKS
ncbi:MAG: hypothetical protein ACTIJA_08130 [Bavariicoccus seileri]|uniref:hypothetical protein n=1 Tax=Bavariicoccus seileri TaxID=549685 RepID=UPI003F9B00BC